MSSLGTGGEEWRRMEGGGRYQRSDSELATSKAEIRSHRMAQAQVRVVDPRGQAVANQPVRVRQIEHAFPFGENLWALDAMYRHGLWDTDRARYWRRRFVEVFNAANALCYWTERPRNDGSKTEDFQGEPRYEGFARCVEWAHGQGLRVKGHPVFWSIPKCIPDWLMRYDLETQWKFIEVRVRSLLARFGGQVTMWDAVNEALWEPAPKNLPHRHWPHIEPIGDIADYVERVLRWAREERPDARLVLNDYGLEAGAVKQEPMAADGRAVTSQLQRERMVELVNELSRRGSPPNAIGLQSHTSGFVTRDQQHELYDQMAAAGVGVQITEFWVPGRGLEQLPEDERRQIEAEYACDHLTHAFAHPAVEAFFFWGFMKSAIEWRGEHSGHELRPMFDAVRSLIREQWWTDQTLATDGEGLIRFSGFYGDYGLRLQHNGHELGGARFNLQRGAGMPLTVMVEAPRGG